MIKDEITTNKILVLIAVGAIIVYMQHAWVPGFFADGYLYTLFGKNGAEGGHWLVPHMSDSIYSRFNQHPPFLFIIEGLFFKIFGSSYTSARIFGALPALFSALLLTLFLIKRHSKKWALLAGVIFVLMPSFIKKSRFPGLDIPLTLAFTITYFGYYYAFLSSDIKKKFFWWVVAGFFLGFGLLLKGPFALVIPASIFIHLLIHKRLKKELLTGAPFVGFAIALTLFSIWPLSLYLTGNFDIFTDYYNGQLFGSIVHGRNTQDSFNPFVYIYHLLLYALPWFFLAIYGMYKNIKEKKMEPLYTLFLCWFLFLLIPLSLMKWKYSHYMLPLYPAFAALAAYPLKDITDKTAKKLFNGTTALFIIGGLALLIFPLTNKSKRDVELFKTAAFVRTLQKQPTTWLNIEGYPTWSMANMITLEFGTSPRMISPVNFKNSALASKTVGIIKKSAWDQIKEIKGMQFKEMLYFKKSNISIIISKDLLKTPFIH